MFAVGAHIVRLHNVRPDSTDISDSNSNIVIPLGKTRRKKRNVPEDDFTRQDGGSTEPGEVSQPETQEGPSPADKISLSCRASGCQVRSEIILNGDLSNVSAQRVLLVFEGLVGYLPANKVSAYEKYYEDKHWNSIIQSFDIDSNVINRILYLTWKANYNFHIVTWYADNQAAEAIAERMDTLSVPIRSVFWSTPPRVAKMLVNNPDITAIYSPTPEHVLTFGSKAVLVTNVSQIGE